MSRSSQKYLSTDCRKDFPHAVASAICACVEGRIVPSPLARNPFGGFVLFLATGRNKLYLDNYKF